MVQHTSRSKKYKKRPAVPREQEIPWSVEGETEYAFVTKMLGNRRVMAQCIEGEKLCKIPKRTEWIAVGDLVLVSPRACEPSKCDVLYKYAPTDAARMRRRGELHGLLVAPGEDRPAYEDVEFADDDDAMCVDAI